MYDLHIHSSVSLDGFLSPEKIVSIAHEKGLTGIAITDHDNVNGTAEAIGAGAKLGMEVIPGVELLANYHKKIIHVVGLSINPEEPSLLDYLAETREMYTVNNQLRVGGLLGMGLPLSKEQVCFLIESNCCIGHKYKDKLCTDYLEEWGIIGEGNPIKSLVLEKLKVNYQCYKTPELRDVISVIHKAGGLAMYAHPYQYSKFMDYNEWQYNMDISSIDAMLAEMKSDGLDGVEVFYFNHDKTQINTLLTLAHKHNLLASGGSDFHGYEKRDGRDVGKGLHCDLVPDDAVEAIKARLGERYE